MKLRKLLPLLFAVLAFGCSESEEAGEFDNWQSRNEAYYSDVYTRAQAAIAGGDTSWKIIKSFSYEDTLATDRNHFIVVHVTESGTGSGSPLFTDSVLVDYQGRLIPSKSFPAGYVFNQSWYGDSLVEVSARPAHLRTSALIDGFSTALQHMRIGDRWTVYIPYTLGYGKDGNTTSNIQGYSTLIFDIRLRAYYRAGTIMPGNQARQGRWVTE